MDESKHRSKLNSQICSLEKVLSKILHHITDSFRDTVTYKGRPYREEGPHRDSLLAAAGAPGPGSGEGGGGEGLSPHQTAPPSTPTFGCTRAPTPPPKDTPRPSARDPTLTHTAAPTQPSRAQCIQYKFERCKQINRMLGKLFVCTAWKEILYLIICMYSYYI